MTEFWNSCESCHAGPPPAGDYPGARCSNCGGTIVRVLPAASADAELERARRVYNSVEACYHEEQERVRLLRKEAEARRIEEKGGRV